MELQNEDKNKEEEKKTKKKWQKSYFDVLGICCSSEVPLIENILKSLDGVKEYSVIVPSRTVIVVHDSLLISPFQIAKALNQAKFEANVRVDGKANFKNKWPSPFAVASGILLLLSFLKFVYPPLRWIAVAAVAAGIYPILAKAVASIGRKRVDINILVIITVAATLAMQDYMEAAAAVFLFTIAEWLETRASYKATAVMQSLMSLAPQKATIAETGEEVEVDEVKVNTIVAVKAGETIPIDGIVVDGNCEVDEKTLTGEAYPVPKQRDSTVWAGTINLNGYVSVKTTSLASDCVVAKMAKLVEEAQSSKTKSQRLIDKCSQYYTPAIILVSGGIAVVPAVMKLHNLNHWFHLALVVLVSACPCGLILSTPVATFCALTKAATSGLLIKSADYLDTLSKIKITAFDKTGTITRGEFIVIEFRSLSRDISLHNLLYWVSSVESKSSHPMAATIVDYAKYVNVEPRTEEVEDCHNFPGEGIYGKIDGNDIYIGNKRIGSRAKCSTVPEIEVDTKGGKTVGYIYVGERLAGVFNLSDACRSGVAQAMKELKDLGIKTAMLTGDNQDAAMHAQEQLGNAMDVVHGELLPEDKSKIILEFKKEGPTAMVGDGVNDAPALATADIGISMGISGSALATQTGHIILMSNDIRRIPQAIRLARRSRRKVVENLFISITLKVGILVLAFTGHPLIWAAVLADVGTCLLVILNSMLLLRDKDKTKNKKCYKASSTLLNGKKLEGDAEEELDLETGLLTKTGQCNSGCCGDKKKQEKVKPSSKSSSAHRHSGCCGDKQQQDNVKMTVKESCCGGKSKILERDLASLRSCNKNLKIKGGSGCCDKKKEKLKETVAKSCCEEKEKNVEMQILGGQKLIDLEKCLAGETCKSSCCGTKEKAAEAAYKVDCNSGSCKKTLKQSSCHEKTCLDTETGDSKLVCCGEREGGKVGEQSDLEVKNERECKSGCCSDERKQTEEITLASEEETESLDCSSGCCENKATVKQSCHENAGLEIEAGDLKLVCCGGDEKQTGEITMACEEETDGSDCSSTCCGNKEEVEQSCHEKACLDIEAGVSCDLKLACCGNTEGEVKEKLDLEEGLQIKNQGQCMSVCGLKEDGSSSLLGKEREIVKVLSQSSSCCTSPTELHVKKKKKIEICCKVKTPEAVACGSIKCKERGKRHIGKSCCRSYAKEYCTHRHHHHHHHHVGAV
ncbi:PREDICTED: putative cadmium/zinc-transporting ATPase HMA4 [Brassica oleracea var. oleracea]|uniref:HMA domain-containing protein n=1 Tax=Brassica oleracea var. oleracea TaxID=109376 RepID=A0A0D3BEJ5_BRAOL|nr:PREDICTED: putative cadmium/zinc-transporting ATPase HMA4 [Brassica oleracea var. oleracea]XP_013629797.1 PREDICTED: putative cadmium/zinc-transporting ATPase HMA4 [Brassica oleracea var. oleracea]